MSISDNIPLGVPPTATQELSFQLPWWKATLVYGWISGTGTTVSAGLRIQQEIKDKTANNSDLSEEIVLVATVREWLIFMGWLAAQGLYSDDIDLEDEAFTGPERDIAEFADGVAELMYQAMYGLGGPDGNN